MKDLLVSDTGLYNWSKFGTKQMYCRWKGVCYFSVVCVWYDLNEGYNLQDKPVIKEQLVSSMLYFDDI